MLVRKLRTLRQKLTDRPVVATPGAALRLERGDLGVLQGAARVAIVASWSQDARMSLSLSRYLHALSECGFTPVVVSVSQVSGPLLWPHGLPDNTVVVRRRNVGYDFGSWSAALEALPQVRRAKHVLLTNDSMAGPFWALDQIVERATQSNAGLVGLTDTFQIGRSIQSYFMMFNGGILNAPEWRRFFRSVRAQKEKMDYVWRYELKVAVIAVSGAFGWQILFPASLVGALHQNPSLDRWRQLLEQGFPFVKRTLWTHPDYLDRATQAGAYLERKYSVAVEDWLPPGTPIADIGGAETNEGSDAQPNPRRTR